MMMMMTTFARLVVALAKECMTVQLATSAKALVAGLNSTGTATMSNWPFPPYPPVPWTKAQEQAYQQAQRAQLPKAPL